MNKKALAILEVVGMPKVSGVQSLAADKTMVLEEARPVLVYCLTGTLWLTRAGQSEDIVLRAGETRKLEGRGRIVISAFEDSRLTVE